MGAEVAASLRGRAALVALAALPWLGLFGARGGDGAGSSLGVGLAVLAALHGAGSLVAWAADLRSGAWLRVSWGAAALIAVGGTMMMAGAYGARGQSALLFLCVIAHSVELARGARAYAAALDADLLEGRGWRWGLAAAVLAVALLHALGAAGAVDSAAWDGEAHALGQLRLLADTGHLGDAVGFARSQSLGGGFILRALAGLSGARTMEALGMAAFLALAASRLMRQRGEGRRLGGEGESGREGALWAGLVGLACVTFSRLPADAALYWWPAALLLAGLISLEEAEVPGPSACSWRRALPAGLLAAALAVIHHALVPAALALGIAALWPHRRGRGALLVAALALAAVAPFLVERALALGALPAGALARLIPRAGFSPLRLALVAVMAVVLAPLLRWLVAARRPALVLAAGLASGIVPFTAARPHAGAYVFVAMFALLAFAAIVSARAPRAEASRWSLVAALLSLFLIVSIYEAQERSGGLRWSYRWTALSTAAGYMVNGPVASPSPSSVLIAVPAGATVALWIGQPERIDHRRHRLIDLRTPYLAALRAKRPERFLAALDALAPDFLLFEEPLVDRGTLVGRACATLGATCDGVFARLAATHRTVWRGEGLRLLALRAPVTAAGS